MIKGYRTTDYHGNEYVIKQGCFNCLHRKTKPEGKCIKCLFDYESGHWDGWEPEDSTES